MISSIPNWNAFKRMDKSQVYFQMQDCVHVYGALYNPAGCVPYQAIVCLSRPPCCPYFGILGPFPFLFVHLISDQVLPVGGHRGRLQRCWKTGNAHPCRFLWAPGFCLACLMPLGCAAHCLLTWLGYTHWIVSWPKLTPKSLSAACCALCPVRTLEHINLLNSSINPASCAFPSRCSWEMVSRLLLPLSCHQVTSAVSEHTRRLATHSSPCMAEPGPWLQ